VLGTAGMIKAFEHLLPQEHQIKLLAGISEAINTTD
jgi:hypothetical protein